jgi:hypothetical protein
MNRTAIVAGILIAAAVGVALPAHAASVNIGVQTSSIKLGINLGPTPPPVVVVPGPAVVGPPGPPPPPPVYYAPNLPYNYFVYQKTYYLYHQGRWFRARRYNGPWTAIAIAQVPRPILGVPVEHYHVPPAHWKHHGPPPWAHEKEQEQHENRGHGYGHAKDRK